MGLYLNCPEDGAGQVKEEVSTLTECFFKSGNLSDMSVSIYINYLSVK